MRDQVLTSHRFGYLQSELGKIGAVGKSPIEKTTIIIRDGYNIIWDLKDGILDASEGPELLGTMYKYLSLYPNKPYIYVKTSYSDSMCRYHVALASETNGHVITCPKFSLYNEQQQLFQNRFALRKQVKNGLKIEYAGLDCVHVNIAPYNGNAKKFKYPISAVESQRYFGLRDHFGPHETPMNVPTKEQEALALAEKFGSDFIFHKKKLNSKGYKDMLLRGNCQFQPFGISIRHSTWEAMILGVPSLMYDISYLTDELRKQIIIYNDDMTKDDVLNKIASIDRGAIIDYFESNMTPEKIVKNVLNQCDKIMYG